MYIYIYMCVPCVTEDLLMPGLCVCVWGWSGCMETCNVKCSIVNIDWHHFVTKSQEANVWQMLLSDVVHCSDFENGALREHRKILAQIKKNILPQKMIFET